MDSFYKPLNAEQKRNVEDYNFDHPDAFDWELLNQCLKDISRGYTVQIPQYDFVSHSRKENDFTIFTPGDIVMFEGILSLYSTHIREYFTLKLFVATDADIRVCRRLQRDLLERGRQVKDVLIQYQKTVKPSFDLFCKPTQQFADIIIPHGGQNRVAIDLLVTHIRTQLHHRGRIDIREAYSKVKQPSNVSEHEEITLDLVRSLMLLNDQKKVKELLIDPYHEMIKTELQRTKNKCGAKKMAIISLIQDEYVEALADELGIEKFFYLPKPKGLISPKSGRSGFTRKILNQSSPSPLATPLMEEDSVEKKVQKRSLGPNVSCPAITIGSEEHPIPKFGTNALVEDYSLFSAIGDLQTCSEIFIMDALTFSGNRVRSVLLWLVEQSRFSKVNCINMIGSEAGLYSLAHSFNQVKFLLYLLFLN
eukprot:UN24997